MPFDLPFDIPDIRIPALPPQAVWAGAVLAGLALVWLAVAMIRRAVSAASRAGRAAMRHWLAGGGALGGLAGVPVAAHNMAQSSVSLIATLLPVAAGALIVAIGVRIAFALVGGPRRSRARAAAAPRTRAPRRNDPRADAPAGEPAEEWPEGTDPDGSAWVSQGRDRV